MLHPTSPESVQEENQPYTKMVLEFMRIFGSDTLRDIIDVDMEPKAELREAV